MIASFIIPTYNKAAYLVLALQSVLAQTVKDWEGIIINDCSTDTSKEVADWFIKKDPRFRYMWNEKNLGACFTRNIANRAANGKYLFVLDGDDLAAPRRLELTLKRFEAGAELVYGSANVIDALNNPICTTYADAFDMEKAKAKHLNYIVHSTMAYTKDVALRFPYPEDKEIQKQAIDDWAQQTLCWMGGVKFDFVPNVLGAYRVVDNSISAGRDEDAVMRKKLSFLESLKEKVPA